MPSLPLLLFAKLVCAEQAPGDLEQPVWCASLSLGRGSVELNISSLAGQAGMWLQAGVLQAAPLALALLRAHLLMSAEAYSCSPSAKGLEWCFTLQW